MSAVQGTVQDGQFVPDVPLGVPNGTRAELRLVDEEPPGTFDPQSDNSPEGIAAWLAWYDTMKPLNLTPEDEERIRKARAEQRAFELATWEQQGEQLEEDVGMKRYLLDTNALSDWINDRHGFVAKVRQARAGGSKVGTCVPVIGELFYGLELSASRDENLREARAALPRLTIWPFDRREGEEFGRCADLHRRGRPMQVVDVQLASIALLLGNCTVVSSDTDLLAVPGLSVENWAV